MRMAVKGLSTYLYVEALNVVAESFLNGQKEWLEAGHLAPGVTQEAGLQVVTTSPEVSNDLREFDLKTENDKIEQGQILDKVFGFRVLIALTTFSYLLYK